MVSTVVSAPAVVTTICDTGFVTNALNVVQPNRSITATVYFANISPAVSVYMRTVSSTYGRIRLNNSNYDLNLKIKQSE